MRNILLKRLWLLLVVPVLALSLGLLNSGCGDSSDDENTSGFVKILVMHDLSSARSLDADIDSMVLTCYDRAGQIIYGPVKKAKYSQVLIEDVPMNVRSLSIGYFAKNSVKGVFVQAFDALESGRVVRIIDPEWQDIASFDCVTGSVGPDYLRVHTGEYAIFKVMGLVTARTWVEDLSYYITTDDEEQEEGELVDVLMDLTPITDFVSSDTSIASITEGLDTGTLATHVAGGPIDITATIGKLTETAQLEVTDETITSIKLSDDELVYPYSRDYMALEMAATWSDGATSDVTLQCGWTSSIPGLLGVTDGVLRAYAVLPNTVEVTGVMVSDGKSFEDSCKVTIADSELSGLSLTMDPATIFVGDSSAASAKGLYTDPDTGELVASVELLSYEVVWTSSDPKVAAPDEDGFVQGIAPGTCEITATVVSDSTISAKAAITVDEPPVDET